MLSKASHIFFNHNTFWLCILFFIQFSSIRGQSTQEEVQVKEKAFEMAVDANSIFAPSQHSALYTYNAKYKVNRKGNSNFELAINSEFVKLLPYDTTKYKLTSEGKRIDSQEVVFNIRSKDLQASLMHNKWIWDRIENRIYCKDLLSETLQYLKKETDIRQIMREIASHWVNLEDNVITTKNEKLFITKKGFHLRRIKFSTKDKFSVVKTDSNGFSNVFYYGSKQDSLLFRFAFDGTSEFNTETDVRIWNDILVVPISKIRYIVFEPYSRDLTRNISLGAIFTSVGAVVSTAVGIVIIPFNPPLGLKITATSLGLIVVGLPTGIFCYMDRFYNRNRYNFKAKN